MAVITALHIGLTYVLWRVLKDRVITVPIRIGIGILYGITAVLSTHFGVDYGDMVLNVRDLGPMSAGLFFDPVSGIIAGFIGGIERYIAGTYFGIGSFTRIACSVSTILAGIMAAFMNVFIFKGKKPSGVYSFFMGAVIEVFHMYVVLITHRNDMAMAFKVVSICSIPMILFSGIGLACTSIVIKMGAGEWTNPFIRSDSSEIPISQKFQVWLFGVTSVMMVLSFGFSYAVQTASSEQSARDDINVVIEDVRNNYEKFKYDEDSLIDFTIHAGTTGNYFIYDDFGHFVAGTQPDYKLSDVEIRTLDNHDYDTFFNMTVMGDIVYCSKNRLDSNRNLLVGIPRKEVYMERNRMAYETFLADVLAFTVVYMLVSMLVQQLVVHNLHLVNESLQKITDGDLTEKVNVHYASEFSSLSEDINQTVTALKGYIDAAEERIKQELILAKNIQESALPTNFAFKHDGFEIFADMNPAKQVGGDFYDFFFVDQDKLALVIADVSGKGIPAAMFMMKSKTTIRGFAEAGYTPAELFEMSNNVICEGNETNMFVTVWIGIIDLNTGVMKCCNAGHEYPVLMRNGRNFEIYNDKHLPALGIMEGIEFVEYEIDLKPGDTIYVYTDGVPEAVNTAVEQYGTDRLLDVLNEHKEESMKDILSAVKDNLDDFVGTADQFDDVTMLGFRYNGMQE